MNTSKIVSTTDNVEPKEVKEIEALNCQIELEIAQLQEAFISLIRRMQPVLRSPDENSKKDASEECGPQTQLGEHLARFRDRIRRLHEEIADALSRLEI